MITIVDNLTERKRLTEMSEINEKVFSCDELVCLATCNRILDAPASDLKEAHWLTPALLKDLARAAILHWERISANRSE